MCSDKQSTDLVVSSSANYLMPAMSITEALTRRTSFVAFVKQVLKNNIDYGVIPGTGKQGQEKKCLMKPGAEKLMSFFGYAVKFEMVEKTEDWTGVDHGGEPFFYYLARAVVLRGDRVIAEGDGSCNSWEKKYRWRNSERKCPACGSETIFISKQDGGWFCWVKKGGCGAKFAQNEPAIITQVPGKTPNPDIFDQVNTLLKMAEKRALIAATLISTNASEYFTQDLDDNAPSDYSEAIDGEFDQESQQPRPNQPAAQQQQRAPQQSQSQPAAAVVCLSCGKQLTKGQVDLSVRKFGEPLCPICQKSDFGAKHRAAEAQAAPQGGYINSKYSDYDPGPEG